jgi:hypothetical protein
VRAARLFLQSRRTGWTLLLILAAGILAGVVFRQLNTGSALLNQALIGIPLLPAVIIGISVQSPFGDVERASGNWLLPFRWLQLGLLIVPAALLLIVSTLNTPSEPSLALVRNLAGLTGIALAGNRILGPLASWVAPLAFAVVALVIDPLSRWAWLTNRSAEGWSLWIASGLLVSGLVAITVVRDREMVAEGAQEMSTWWRG